MKQFFYSAGFVLTSLLSVYSATSSSSSTNTQAQAIALFTSNSSLISLANISQSNFKSSGPTDGVASPFLASVSITSSQVDCIKQGAQFVLWQSGVLPDSVVSNTFGSLTGGQGTDGTAPASLSKKFDYIYVPAKDGKRLYLLDWNADRSAAVLYFYYQKQ